MIGPVFSQAMCRYAFFLVCILANLLAGPRALALVTFTANDEILKLSREEAANDHPVSVEGVVIYYAPHIIDGDYCWGDVFLHDGVRPIYVNLKAPVHGLSVGDQIRVDGVTGPGNFAPIIEEVTVAILGKGIIPEPVEVNVSRVFSGRFSGEWVALDATVRMATTDGYYLILDIGDGSNFVDALVPQYTSSDVPEGLIGSKIHVRGVVSQVLNPLGQVINDRIWIPNLDYISQVEPAPEKGLEFVTKKVSQLGRYDPDPSPNDYVELRGQVTYMDRFGLIYLQDDSGGVRVKPMSSRQNIAVGDHISVIGIPMKSGNRILLGNAVVTSVERGELEKPPMLSPLKSVELYLDARRISLEGNVVEYDQTEDGVIIHMNDNGLPIEAYLRTDNQRAAIKKARPGNYVRVTGISEIETLGHDSAQMVLRLASLNDIQVMERAPWWNVRRMAYVAMGVLTIALLAFLWTFTLKRKIGLQTEEIRQRLERETDLENRLRELFNGMPDPLLLTDEEGRIQEANPAAAKFYDVSRSDLKLKRLHDFVPRTDQTNFQDFFHELMAGKRMHGQLEHRNAQGHLTSVEWNANRILVDGKQLLLIQVRDLTERRSLEAQLTHAQRMETVGRLASGIAHDFNNLLTILRGGVGMLGDDLDQESEDGRIVRMMDDAVTQASKLTHKLLTFSRREPLVKSNVSLNVTISGVGALLERVKPDNVRLFTNPEPDVPDILADGNMLEQVMLNLAINAFDAMPDGGSLVLSASSVEVDEEHAQRESYARVGRFVVISVKDDGIGMDERTSDRIFEPFFSTKEVGKGTGLGLSIVYGVVSEHSGWIELETAPGEGSEFRLYFPVDSADEVIEDRTRAYRLHG